jgi:endonuclease/exonuclease/phosphatase family metal-dependent hydrolase
MSRGRWTLAMVRAWARIGFDLCRSVLAPVRHEPPEPPPDPVVRPAPGPEPPPGGELVLVSWNIHRDYDAPGVRATLARIVAEHEPHLMLLQEVPVAADGPFWEDRAVAPLLANMHLAYLPIHRVLHPSLYYPFEHSGVLTASRWPPATTTGIALPVVTRPKLGRTHQVVRVALATGIDMGTRTLRLVNLHLENTAGPGGRRAQVQRVLEAIGDTGEPVVLAGDLNTALGPVESTFRALRAAGFTRGRLAGRRSPLPALDHVFVRDLEVVEGRVLPHRGSDHRAVVCRVRMQ